MEPLMDPANFEDNESPQRPCGTGDLASSVLAAIIVFVFFLGFPWGMVAWQAAAIFHPQGFSYIGTSVVLSIGSLPVLALISWILVAWPRWFPAEPSESDGGFSGIGIFDIFMPQILGTILYYIPIRLIVAHIKEPDIEGWLKGFAGSSANAQAALFLTSYQYTIITFVLCMLFDCLWEKYYDDPKSLPPPSDKA